MCQGFNTEQTFTEHFLSTIYLVSTYAQAQVADLH